MGTDVRERLELKQGVGSGFLVGGLARARPWRAVNVAVAIGLLGGSASVFSCCSLPKGSIATSDLPEMTSLRSRDTGLATRDLADGGAAKESFGPERMETGGANEQPTDTSARSSSQILATESGGEAVPSSVNTPGESTRLESGVAEPHNVVPEPAEEGHPALLNPPLADEQAPDVFKVRFETTKGDILVEVHRSWAPIGVDRFYNLVKIGYYDNVAFFRVIKNFVAQFGISGEPETNQAWSESHLQDEEVRESNLRGFVSFAKSRNPNSRTTQIFINLADRNRFLDKIGFPPIGRVVDGLAVVDALHSGYGGPEDGGPRQETLRRQGNRYLRELYPNMDYVVKAGLVE